MASTNYDTELGNLAGLVQQYDDNAQALEADNKPLTQTPLAADLQDRIIQQQRLVASLKPTPTNDPEIAKERAYKLNYVTAELQARAELQATQAANQVSGQTKANLLAAQTSEANARADLLATQAANQVSGQTKADAIAANAAANTQRASADTVTANARALTAQAQAAVDANGSWYQQQMALIASGKLQTAAQRNQVMAEIADRRAQTQVLIDQANNAQKEVQNLRDTASKIASDSANNYRTIAQDLPNAGMAAAGAAIAGNHGINVGTQELRPSLAQATQQPFDAYSFAMHALQDKSPMAGAIVQSGAAGAAPPVPPPVGGAALQTAIAQPPNPNALPTMVNGQVGDVGAETSGGANRPAGVASALQAYLLAHQGSVAPGTTPPPQPPLPVTVGATA